MEKFYAAIGGSRQAVQAAMQRVAGNKELESSVINLVHQWRDNHPRMGSRTMYKSLIRKGADIPIT